MTCFLIFPSCETGGQPERRRTNNSGPLRLSQFHAASAAGGYKAIVDCSFRLLLLKSWATTTDPIGIDAQVEAVYVSLEEAKD